MEIRSLVRYWQHLFASFGWRSNRSAIMRDLPERFALDGRHFDLAAATHLATVFESASGGLFIPPLFTVLAGRELRLYLSKGGTFFQVPVSTGYVEEVSPDRARTLFEAGAQHVPAETAFSNSLCR